MVYTTFLVVVIPVFVCGVGLELDFSTGLSSIAIDPSIFYLDEY
jgi:hypothetical protein